MFVSEKFEVGVDRDKPLVEQLSRLVDALFEHIWRSPDALAELLPPPPVSPPVPFLGRVDTAEVLTVGINPSDSEVRLGHFPEKVTSAEMTRRLLRYFERDEVLSDPRLSAWELALNELGLSYTDGTAAHIEMSPRTARPLDDCDPYLFQEMVRYDLPFMFHLLDVLTKPRVLLMAGTVAGAYPLGAFLGEVAPESDWHLVGEGHSGHVGPFGYHTLCSEASSFGCFYCSADLRMPGESAFLKSCIREQRSRLELLIGQPREAFETP